MSILWIILIVILVLALLGFFGRGRFYGRPLCTGTALAPSRCNPALPGGALPPTSNDGQDEPLVAETLR